MGECYHIIEDLVPRKTDRADLVFSRCRCENYAISLLEQCENLEEVETFLETKTHDGVSHKDANYIMAILDSRKKFVAHERFQYVLLKKFGESEIPVRR